MIGIVILNYEAWEVSLRCMQSIKKTVQKEPYRIYFIDNASKHPMPEKIKQFILEQSVVFLQAEENRGYAAGNNIGMKQALQDGCDVVLISNNDIIYRKRSIEELYYYLLKHKNIGIAGPKVVGIDGKIQPSAVSRKTGIKEIFQLYTVAKFVFRKQWNTYFSLDKNNKKDFRAYHVSGCCFMMNRKTAEYLYPLDEHTVLYNEELIIGIRMEQAGIETWYHPYSVVEHHHGYTTKKVKPFMYQCIADSEQYYCREYLHAAKWQLWLLRQYRKLLYWVRCGR